MDVLRDFWMCWFTLKQYQRELSRLFLSPVARQKSTLLDANPYKTRNALTQDSLKITVILCANVMAC